MDAVSAINALPGGAYSEKAIIVFTDGIQNRNPSINDVAASIDDRTFAGAMTVKVGPVSTRYTGKATFEKLDAATRTAEIVGSGRDVRGRDSFPSMA